MRAKNNWALASFLIALICSLALFHETLFGEERGVSQKLKIAATIPPIADIAKQIGGENVEVVSILSAGADPHTFEFSSGKVRALQDAKVVFMIGHGFDDWVRTAMESIPKVRLVNVDGGIDLIKPARGVVDPHYWLSLPNGAKIAKTIALTFEQLDPANEGLFDANLRGYLAELEQTDRAIRNRFAALKTRRMVTYHNGWNYVARDYNLHIVGHVEFSEGRETTPKHLADLADLVSRYHIKALFCESVMPRPMAESVAQDLNLRLYMLDPIGGARGYLALMKENASVIQEALAHG